LITPAPTLVLRARHLLTLAGEGPAVGEQLFAPLKKLDNAALVVRDGLVAEVLQNGGAGLPAGAQARDMGDVCIAPACVNAHTHLQLSHLEGRTVWRKGFARWLASLIPLLAEPVSRAAIDDACQSMAGVGTGLVGDIAGSLPDGFALVRQACRETGLNARLFCEWFGFATPFPDEHNPWPPQCGKDIADNLELKTCCAPAGHALYSTAPEILRIAHRYCRKTNSIFTFHLAESSEETRLLTNGDGPLRDLYEGIVLPENWRAPGLRPLAYAEELQLLGPGTLAVHGVQLNPQEIRRLAASGAALCLCPRSNYNLGLGDPPVNALLESGALLCLGTDGLTSNTDLDVRKEAVSLREEMDVPPEALVRLLTVNGAAALGIEGAGQLAPGCPAAFCVLPSSLVY
jgi:cytosine/adenosine deaminase-related metal-dependent hydrolase